MAEQQRSVIITAIVLAIILGGALVWLLNRTPAQQIATQAPGGVASVTPAAQEAGTDLVSVEEADRLAQASDTQQLPAATSGSVSGVATTAPTGPAENMLVLAAATACLGLGSLFALCLPRL